MKQLHLFPDGHLQPQGTARQKKLLRADSLHLPDCSVIGEDALSPEVPSQLVEELSKPVSCVQSDPVPTTYCTQAKTGSSYYDIPIPEDAPAIENKICQYLSAHNIHVSHPSMRSSLVKPIERSLSGTLLRRKSLILERRNARAPSDFVVPFLSLSSKTVQAEPAINS